MKKTLLIISQVFVLMLLGQFVQASNSAPDSTYIFAYAIDPDRSHNGLRFAWSNDKVQWHPIGQDVSNLRSDYGQWGAQKKMISPFLFQDQTGLWHCIWTLNKEDGVFAHASSKDLVYWGRQSYPVVTKDQAPEDLTIEYDASVNAYLIKFKNGGQVFATQTSNFKDFPKANRIQEDRYTDLRQTANVFGQEVRGTVHRVAWSVLDKLLTDQKVRDYKAKFWNETAALDKDRFADLKDLKATIKVTKQSKEISDMLMGIFFEDISHAADGGLYAELVQNRGFEFDINDVKGRDKTWTNDKFWSVKSQNKGSFSIESADPLHINNKHYAILDVKEIGFGLINDGFDGIAIKAGDKYDLSLFARVLDGKRGAIKVRLVDENGKNYGETTTKSVSDKWKKYDAVIIAKETADKLKLEVIPQSEAKYALDMISLFPQKTFKGRKNGLRADLAQVIADMKPRFVRFPGGCLVHGDGLDNMYRWKNTVGPLESRVPDRNIWNYHQSMGLGYFEYFQFCEDIGAEPLPVVPAGVPCQNSGSGGAGQQGGIPMDEMDEYVQEVLDLIEWANGDVKTEWGKKRAEAGHPKPFNLKYIGVGNEDLITDIFEERFTMIFNAVKEKHPEITVIGTVGPFSEGTDYEEGWGIANKLNIPIVDEHYYQPAGWFIYNQDFYDKYDRNKSKVYLGEYAVHLPGRVRTLESALTEAIYLAALERNGDVVAMSSYAPLLAKEGKTNWNPDLIYFNNTEVKPTPGYYVQQLYGVHSGNHYFTNYVQTNNMRDDVNKRIGSSVVQDSATGDLIIKLINILPTPIATTIDLSEFGIADQEATKIVLSGKINDNKLEPITSKIKVSKEFKYEMPAYSFTVIRLKTK